MEAKPTVLDAGLVAWSRTSALSGGTAWVRSRRSWSSRGPSTALDVASCAGSYFFSTLVVPILAFASASTKKLFVGVYPIAMVGILYDSMRFFKNLGITPSRVHDCDLRRIELSLFGVTSDGVKMTLHDWFQAGHTTRFLDFWCAIPYGTFIFVSIAFAAFLYRRDYLALRRYAWTFFALNVVGFVTYHIYPAAPPWYFHAHGCLVDLAARASEGPNLARVDAALGIHYFGGFYGRSNDIFGAMPSLHVAYPLLIVLEGWRHFRAPLRATAAIYAASMLFAAVYLDHHWVLDVIAGIVVLPDRAWPLSTRVRPTCARAAQRSRRERRARRGIA